MRQEFPHRGESPPTHPLHASKLDTDVARRAAELERMRAETRALITQCRLAAAELRAAQHRSAQAAAALRSSLHHDLAPTAAPTGPSALAASHHAGHACGAGAAGGDGGTRQAASPAT